MFAFNKTHYYYGFVLFFPPYFIMFHFQTGFIVYVLIQFYVKIIINSSKQIKLVVMMLSCLRNHIFTSTRWHVFMVDDMYSWLMTCIHGWWHEFMVDDMYSWLMTCIHGWWHVFMVDDIYSWLMTCIHGSLYVFMVDDIYSWLMTCIHGWWHVFMVHYMYSVTHWHHVVYFFPFSCTVRLVYDYGLCMTCVQYTPFLFC